MKRKKLRKQNDLVHHLLKRLREQEKPSIGTKPEPEKRKEKTLANSNYEEKLIKNLRTFLTDNFEFQHNQITDSTEYRRKASASPLFHPVSQRELNTFCLEAHESGISCWDRDISRYINSLKIPSYHPFRQYLANLPVWDGEDRVGALARRVSDNPVWINGFTCWMRGMTAQWIGIEGWHGNSVAPVLVSREQGKHKSTFCKMLLPEELQNYYTDSFNLESISAAEQKITLFGLINLDEMDKFTPRKTAFLKNLMQMAGISVRKAYKKNYSTLPRIASFIATSNQKGLLSDPTGSRRFLCVDLHHKIDCSPIDYAQLYSQLKTEIEQGKQYWFTTEEEREIEENNKPFYKQDAEEELFFALFRLPLPDETPQLFSALQVYNSYRKHYPASSKSSNITKVGQSLSHLGAEKIHTRDGNRYKIIRK